jgi:hypothetical protein
MMKKRWAERTKAQKYPEHEDQVRKVSRDVASSFFFPVQSDSGADAIRRARVGTNVCGGKLHITPKVFYPVTAE